MCVVTAELSPQDYHDYCVVGAGPAGLQLGYFLERANRDYIIFERSNTSGYFFTVYPRHRKLISINKRHTGQINHEFSFRHDWNSLISDDETLLLKHYSEELFPSADVLVQYLQDYQKKLGIKVQFNTQVRNIQRVEENDHDTYTMNDQLGNTYHCRTLIVATGMGKPNIPDIQGIEKTLGYESFPTNPDLYENKSVLILGIGNSAMETAESIYGHTQYVHVISRRQDINLAWSTHYVGDLRAVNNNMLDTFLLKSLDGVTYLDMKDASIQARNGKYYVILNEHYLSSQDNDVNIPDNFNLRRGYDIVIRCLGFTFDPSIF
ncbi:FAD-dependent oxidoreductase domain-containing protein 2, partial [Bulinus truncatus]